MSQFRNKQGAKSRFIYLTQERTRSFRQNRYRNEITTHSLIAQNKEQQDQIKVMNLMLKEVLVQQTSIVSKLHDTEIELRRQSKFQGKDSTQEEARKVFKPFGPRAKLNEKANMCTILPTTALNDNAVSPLYDSHKDVSLLYGFTFLPGCALCKFYVYLIVIIIFFGELLQQQHHSRCCAT
jgi:hypothetical protein